MPSPGEMILNSGCIERMGGRASRELSEGAKGKVAGERPEDRRVVGEGEEKEEEEEEEKEEEEEAEAEAEALVEKSAAQ